MVSEKCRLCLSESSEVQSIFDTQLYQSVPLSVKIAVCISLPITQEDHFSKFICKKCRMLVDQFYSFRENCMSNYIHLLGLECLRVTELDELITIPFNTTVKTVNADSQQRNQFKSIGLGDDLTRRTDVDINLPLANASNSFTESECKNQVLENETTFILPVAGNHSEHGDNHGSDKLLENAIDTQYAPPEGEEKLGVIASDTEKPRLNIGDGIQLENKFTTDTENNCDSNLEVVYSELEEIIDPSSQFLEHDAIVEEENISTEAPAEVSPYQSQISVKRGDHKEKELQIMVKNRPNTCSKVFLNSSYLSDHYLDDDCSEQSTDLQVVLSPMDTEIMELEINADSTDATHEIKESAYLEGRARWGEKRKYPCEICRKMFKTPAGLRNHMRIHTGERPFLCSQCTRSFSQKGALLNHERTHKGEWPYCCQDCGKGFFRPSDLEKHMRSHTNERPYLCSTCSKGFHQLSGLVVHERIHSGVRPYSCNLCQMTFTQLSNKYRHMKTHAGGKKPYDCDICHRKFADKTEMDLHRAVHQGAKPRICQFCSKGFRKPYELRDHLRRSHTKERPFTCQLCNKSFFVANDLKNHLYIHTGERPHSCTMCSQRFTQAGNLKRHHLRHHSDNPLSSIDNKPATLLYIQHVDMKTIQDTTLQVTE